MVGTAEKQSLLEILNPYERLQRLHDLLEVEVEKINIDKRINVKVKKQMEKAQKEYFLNEKIKAIHQELGRKDERGNEVDDLRKRVEECRMPKEAEEKAKELLSSRIRSYLPKKILVEEKADVAQELFMAITYDSLAKTPVAVFSQEGGVEIEELAARHPEKVRREPFSIRGRKTSQEAPSRPITRTRRSLLPTTTLSFSSAAEHPGCDCSTVPG